MSCLKNITAGLFLATVRILLGAIVISMVLGFPPVNAESFTIRIPVSCTGSDCQAVLSDMEGKELDDVEIKVGIESFFEISLEGSGKEQYLVKLIDKDTASRIFDRTEYQVTVTNGIGENGEILRTVTVQPLGKEEKSSVLRFRNTNLSHENDPGEIKDPDVTQLPGVTGVNSGGSSPKSRSLKDSGNEDKSQNSDHSGGKLPQTGSRFLWLAPWMAAAGGMMIVAGHKVRKKQEREDL